MIKTNYMRNIILVVLFIAFTCNVSAQPYVYIDTDTKGLIQSNTTWVDVNKDGFLDIIITGERYSGNQQLVNTYLYLNNKKGKFYRKNAGLLDFYRAATDYADFDRDGDMDMFITGETAQHNIVSRIYKNNGSGYFSAMNPAIIGVRDGSVDIEDYNKDGKLDILICGENNGKIFTRVYKNISNTKFVDQKVDLIALYGGSIKWGDYDRDNDLDILICGETKEGYAITKIYQNEGNDTFNDIGLNMLGVKQGEAIWADFDGDNDLDVFVCGESNDYNLLSRFYRNEGINRFTEIAPLILGVRSGNVEATDFDCDGDIDLLVSGENIFGPSTKIYRNDGDFSFTEIDTGLPGVYLGGAYWADYDNDCDKDLFIVGLDDCFDFEAKLFRSDADVDIDIIKPTTTESSLWISSDISFAERKTYYYFVWSSCYCNPEGFEYGVRNKDYHAYVSNIHYLKRPYAMQENFNRIILKSVPEWGQINGGHRVSIGYTTKEAAEAGRRQVIKDYISERFKINYINW